MSGPKSSRYTLTAEQLKKIIEEQERIRRELEEKAKKERECQEALAVLRDIGRNANRHIAFTRETEKEQKYREFAKGKAHSLLEEYYSIARELTAITSVQRAEHTVLLSMRARAEQLFESMLHLENQIVTALKEARTQQAILEGHDLEAALSISFEQIGVVEEQENPVVVDVINTLSAFMDRPISESLRHDLSAAIDQMRLLDDKAAVENYIAITVTPLEKRISEYLEFNAHYAENYKQLKDKYVALCTKCGSSPKVFDCSGTGMSAMEKEIDRLQAEVLHDAEQIYISQTIDEVLVEMGYTVIGKRQVKKKSGKSFTSKLLTYDDGTVVNVTEASNGQVTMEIGGVDDHDRAPDANERVALRKKMEKFCFDFAEIERRLVKRGVVLSSRLGMAPPEEMYAQIINATDYELTGNYRHTFQSHKDINRIPKNDMRTD